MKNISNLVIQCFLVEFITFRTYSLPSIVVILTAKLRNPVFLKNRVSDAQYLLTNKFDFSYLDYSEVKM